LAEDCTHPSDSGRKKVAELLMEFFKTDTIASSWFLANSLNAYPPQIEIPTATPAFVPTVGAAVFNTPVVATPTQLNSTPTPISVQHQPTKQIQWVGVAIVAVVALIIIGGVSVGWLQAIKK
jgi:hypothetical protein